MKFTSKTIALIQAFWSKQKGIYADAILLDIDIKTKVSDNANDLSTTQKPTKNEV